MKYVFITMDIAPMGGAQGYINSKIKWLKNNGYEVFVFYDGDVVDSCEIPELNQYMWGRCFELAMYPYNLPNRMIKNVIEYIAKIVAPQNGEEIIVESSADRSAFWGELIAEKIKAKHFAFLLDERYRGENFHYDDSFSFFDFKLKRGELAGIHNDSIRRLFEGFLDIEDSSQYCLSATADNHVEDSDYVIERTKADCDVCYFGRLGKVYVSAIYDAIKKFATDNSDKLIRFWVVGDEKDIKAPKWEASEVNNLEVVFTGILSPFPRSLANVIDVAIAGSGCATILTEAKIPTIVPDANSCKAIGILGFDTDNTLYSDDERDEDISYSYIKYLYEWGIEKKHSSDELKKVNNDQASKAYAAQLQYVKDSNQSIEYYDVLGIEAQSHIKDNQRMGLFIYRFLGRRVGEKIRKIVRRG